MLSRCCGGLGCRQGPERAALALAGGRARVVSLEPGGRRAGKTESRTEGSWGPWRRLGWCGWGRWGEADPEGWMMQKTEGGSQRRSRGRRDLGPRQGQGRGHVGQGSGDGHQALRCPRGSKQKTTQDRSPSVPRETPGAEGAPELQGRPCQGLGEASCAECSAKDHKPLAREVSICPYQACVKVSGSYDALASWGPCWLGKDHLPLPRGKRIPRDSKQALQTGLSHPDQQSGAHPQRPPASSTLTQARVPRP